MYLRSMVHRKIDLYGCLSLESSLKSVQADFNTKSKAYRHMLAHQSDREYCRAFFPSGITSGAKKYGHEERCVLLLSILILCSSDGVFFDEKMGSSEASIYILVFSLLLLIEKFFRSPEIQKGDIEGVHSYFPGIVQTGC